MDPQIVIAAGTMYGFSAGPEGLSFINFRAGPPSAIRFKDGRETDEVGYWRERLPAPDPITFAAVSPRARLGGRMSLRCG